MCRPRQPASPIEPTVRNVEPPALPYKPAAYWVPIDLVKPWAGNPRDNAAAIAKVANSIREFGFGAAITARYSTRQIIAGHTRLAAAVLLNMTEVPVRFVDLDEERARLLAIADNRLGEIATWNPRKVVTALKPYKPEQLKLVGWKPEQLKHLAVNVEGYTRSAGSSKTPPDDSPAPQTDIVSLAGDCWELGDHRLTCGDLSRELVDALVQHWQRKTGKLALLAGDGRTFDDVRVARSMIDAKPKGTPNEQVHADRPPAAKKVRSAHRRGKRSRK